MDTGETLQFKQQRYSIDEYLEIENASAERHEYFRGAMFAMGDDAGAVDILRRNILTQLFFEINDTPYIAFGSAIAQRDVISVFSTSQDASSPTVIIEVAPHTTSENNHKAKNEIFAAFQTLKEYVIVDSESLWISHFYIGIDSEPKMHIYSSVSDILQLKSLSAELPLRNLYQDTIHTQQYGHAT